jgi:cation diffusion facilitator CzcD-associated flavoprotein CzcO
VPSHLYSFSFAPNPDWPHSFSRQPEIWRYLEDLTTRYRLRRHIRFGTEVLAARWDGPAARWRVRTSRGDLTAGVLISAAGPLSKPRLPDVPGLTRFPGPVFHSARWDHQAEHRRGGTGPTRERAGTVVRRGRAADGGHGVDNRGLR